MGSAVIVIAVVYTLLLSTTSVHGQREDVMCGHQQEVCTCSSTAQECYLELEVEELQTFTSYGLENGTIVTRGITGDTYYLNGSGFQPSLSDCLMRQRRLPECGGPCWSQNYRTLSDFAPNCSMPMTVDGNTYRLFIAVNGRIPGPTIVVTEGQIVVIKVINKLTSEGITIHWHGMHQQGSPWMDGVAFISQAPIVPGAEFDYIFTATPAGTHWYHSHTGAQRTDGLFGALIVKEKANSQALVAINGRLGFQLEEISEHTLTFLDWQRESSLNLFVQLHSTLGFYPSKPVGLVPDESKYPIYRRTRSPDGVEVGPQPYWSGLINGRGRHPNTMYSKLSVFDVSLGNMYRFRLIGAQSLFAYRFSIDGHMLKVIASDGHFIEPIDVHYVIIHTGERYDVVVTANQLSNNYWIRAETLETGQSHLAEAILHYDGASDVQDTTTYSNVMSSDWNCSRVGPCKVLNCPFRSYPPDQNVSCIHLNTLSALAQSGILPRINLVDTNLNLKFLNFGFEGRSSTSAINGRNFRLPVTPYQTYKDAYKNDQNPTSLRSCSECGLNSPSNQCECTYVEEIGGDTYNSANPPTIVFVLSAVGMGNNNDFSHPVHLHGHSFNVLHIEHGVYNSSGQLIDNTDHVVCNNAMCRAPTWNTDALPSITETIQKISAPSSILKDTVIVPAGGYVVIAFQANNPGYWFLHCHIESHQLEGMGVIIREYAESQHNPAPEGINDVGDFSWTVDQYQDSLAGRAPGTDSPSTRSTSHNPTLGMYLVVIATLLGLVLSHY